MDTRLAALIDVNPRGQRILQEAAVLSSRDGCLDRLEVNLAYVCVLFFQVGGMPLKRESVIANDFFTVAVVALSVLHDRYRDDRVDLIVELVASAGVETDDPPLKARLIAAFFSAAVLKNAALARPLLDRVRDDVFVHSPLFERLSAVDDADGAISVVRASIGL